MSGTNAPKEVCAAGPGMFCAVATAAFKGDFRNLSIPL